MTEFRKAVEYELELEQLAKEVEGLEVAGPYGTYQGNYYRNRFFVARDGKLVHDSEDYFWDKLREILPSAVELAISMDVKLREEPFYTMPVKKGRLIAATRELIELVEDGKAELERLTIPYLNLAILKEFLDISTSKDWTQEDGFRRIKRYAFDIWDSYSTYRRKLINEKSLLRERSLLKQLGLK